MSFISVSMANMRDTANTLARTPEADIIIHWGVFRHLRDDVKARSSILLTAIILDVLVLTTFILMKWSQDPFIILIAIVGHFGLERIYLSKVRKEAPLSDHVHH